ARAAAAAGKTKDCHCGGSGAGGGGHEAAAVASPAGAPAPLIVAPTGYVQFFVSHGEGGLSATVRKQQTDTILFDTTQLGTGDLFAVTLLAPAKFTIVNTLGTAKGTATVTFSKAVAARLKATAPVYVDATKSAFTPADVQLSSGQGLVFRVKETARITVTQE